jgi:hypothetical protein
MKACDSVFGHPDSHFLNTYIERKILLSEVIDNTKTHTL